MTLNKFIELLQYLTQDGVDGNFKIAKIARAWIRQEDETDDE